MASSKKRDVLYLYVDKSLKAWLKKIAKEQIGAASLSNVAERILSVAKKNPEILKTALGE